MGDFLEFFGVFFLFVVAAFAIVIGFIVGGTYIFDPAACHAKGDAMRIETQWSFWTGCMINVNGQMLPWSEVVPVERNGKIVFAPKPQVRIGVDQHGNE